MILAALLSSGCFVWDEIEKGQALMEAHSPDSDDSEKVENGSDGSGAPKSARDRLAEYYAKQRAKAPKTTASKDPADKVGSCRIGGSTQFMRRTDCKLRGGTFL